MACDLVSKEQTWEERQREIDEALKGLELQISQKLVSIVVNADGAICFRGWETNRRGVTDACAFRRLQQRSSWSFRQELARAEQQAGRQANLQTINGGVHSHDGGRTWGSH